MPSPTYAIGDSDAIGAVFGFWELVLPEARLFRKPAQMQLPMPGLKPTRPRDSDDKQNTG